MFWRRKPCINNDLADWIVDRFDWLEEQFGKDWLCSRPLVTPTMTFFTAAKDDIAGLASDIARHRPRETF
jgi:hypothetical protein